MKIDKIIESSFRDPSGFIFYQDGIIYRQINTVYKEQYDHLMTSGLYEALINAGLLIPHIEVTIGSLDPDKAYKIIRPEKIPFISYPYEWCFSQLKAAALTTLTIQKKAIEFGMSLKDCSAYNVQFFKGKPVFIDTLSFEKYNKNRPWVGYRQFCQHFLAPLALMRYTDVRFNQLFRVYLDGIPLELASSLLPFSTRFQFALLSHIHLHAKSQKHFGPKKAIKTSNYQMSHISHLGLIDNLENAVKKLQVRMQETEWAHYYEDTNYSREGMQHKKQIIEEFLSAVNTDVVWDLGANVGMFSRVASNKGLQTICFDIDPIAVEKNYLMCTEKGEINILPLIIDLTNPSPPVGWEHTERMSLLERGPAGLVFALALVHHLAISSNLPFYKIASFFNKICKALIIEFIPKNDSQVQRLLSNREDIFSDYTQQSFEYEFSKYFTICKSVHIKDSERILYLMAAT
jgi:hypothetical protein